jgi:hypothetical protein
VGQTLTSTTNTQCKMYVWGQDYIHTILSLYIHYIHCNLVPQQTMVGSYLYYIYMYLYVYIFIIIIHG